MSKKITQEQALYLAGAVQTLAVASKTVEELLRARAEINGGEKEVMGRFLLGLADELKAARDKAQVHVE